MINTRIQQLLDFIKEDSTDSFAIYALALEYDKAGDPQKAIEQLENLRSINPDYLALYYQLGNFYLQQNENNKAEAVLREGILLADAKKNKHTLSELKQLLSVLLNEDQ